MSIASCRFLQQPESSSVIIYSVQKLDPAIISLYSDLNALFLSCCHDYHDALDLDKD